MLGARLSTDDRRREKAAASGLHGNDFSHKAVSDIVLLGGSSEIPSMLLLQGLYTSACLLTSG